MTRTPTAYVSMSYDVNCNNSAEIKNADIQDCSKTNVVLLLYSYTLG